MAESILLFPIHEDVRRGPLYKCMANMMDGRPAQVPRHLGRVGPAHSHVRLHGRLAILAVSPFPTLKSFRALKLLIFLV